MFFTIKMAENRLKLYLLENGIIIFKASDY